MGLRGDSFYLDEYGWGVVPRQCDRLSIGYHRSVLPRASQNA